MQEGMRGRRRVSAAIEVHPSISQAL
jgi:hypothetical protein